MDLAVLFHLDLATVPLRCPMNWMWTIWVFSESEFSRACCMITSALIVLLELLRPYLLRKGDMTSLSSGGNDASNIWFVVGPDNVMVLWMFNGLPGSY